MSDESDSESTLIGRIEEKGKFFPSHIERLGFFISIGLAFGAGYWIWNLSGWQAGVIWPSLICGLPLGVLFLTEAIGRIVYIFHTKS